MANTVALLAETSTQLQRNVQRQQANTTESDDLKGKLDAEKCIADRQQKRLENCETACQVLEAKLCVTEMQIKDQVKDHTALKELYMRKNDVQMKEYGTQEE